MSNINITGSQWKIIIKDLKVSTIIGIHETERKYPQLLYINLCCYGDYQAAASHDSIDDAVDYHTISLKVASLLKENHFFLIETAVHHIGHYNINPFFC